VLPIGVRLKQNRDMEKETGPAPTKPKSLVQWAITPPQSYLIYLVALFLVAGSSFYIGSLHPKKPMGLGPPPISAPRN
jgi:hypothetical protein